MNGWWGAGLVDYIYFVQDTSESTWWKTKYFYWLKVQQQIFLALFLLRRQTWIPLVLYIITSLLTGFQLFKCIMFPICGFSISFLALKMTLTTKTITSIMISWYQFIGQNRKSRLACVLQFISTWPLLMVGNCFIMGITGTTHIKRLGPYIFKVNFLKLFLQPFFLSYSYTSEKLTSIGSWKWWLICR